MMARHKNSDWTLPERIENWEQANTAVLMDIRDELRALNRLLGCTNFLNMPLNLRRVAESTERTDRRLRKKHPLKNGASRPSGR